MSARRAATGDLGRALVLGLGLLLGGGTEPAWAALPPSPLDFRVEPSPVPLGGRAILDLRLRRADPGLAGRAVDIYLVVFVGWDAVQFLTPEGRWSAEPVPYRRGVGLSGLQPIAAEWTGAGPPGFLSLAMVPVNAGADPLSRSNWAFRPVLTMVRIKPPYEDAAARSTATGELLFLGASALAAALLVALCARWPRGHPSP